MGRRTKMNVELEVDTTVVTYAEAFELLECIRRATPSHVTAKTFQVLESAPKVDTDVDDVVKDIVADVARCVEYNEKHEDAGEGYAHLLKENWQQDVTKRLNAMIHEHAIDTGDLDDDDIQELALEHSVMEPGRIYTPDAVLDSYPLHEHEVQVDVDTVGCSKELLDRAIEKCRSGHDFTVPAVFTGCVYQGTDACWHRVLNVEEFAEAVRHKLRDAAEDAAQEAAEEAFEERSGLFVEAATLGGMHTQGAASVNTTPRSLADASDTSAHMHSPENPWPPKAQARIDELTKRNNELGREITAMRMKLVEFENRMNGIRAVVNPVEITP